MIITVSGMPGSGKSTLAEYLAKTFKLKFYSMGKIRRELALAKGMNINELNRQGEKNYSSDKRVDDFLKKLAKKDKLVVDGRMAYYFIPNSIKIFITVDMKEGARRIFERYQKSEKYKNIDEALKELKERMKSDRKRYNKYYHINAFDLDNFDILFDTTDMTIKQAKETIRRSVEKFINNKKNNKS